MKRDVLQDILVHLTCWVGESRCFSFACRKKLTMKALGLIEVLKGFLDGLMSGEGGGGAYKRGGGGVGGL